MDSVSEKAKNLLGKLDIEERRKKAREIEAESMNPTFWKDNQHAATKMKELARIQKEIGDIEELQNLIKEGKEEEAGKKLDELELYLYLSGPYDKNNAILTIHAGQGGVDAMDWSEILFRMYARYFDIKGWQYQVIDENKGEEAGIKSATITVEGGYAYGHLKKEQGVHRLVRLSPFNADKLRHTSFALVDVLPVIDDSDEVDLREDDLEWDFYRASSHGGQNVQKVSSAVRLKHKPTGIVVTCQTERYQAQNRENALKLLKSKLWAKNMEERKEEEKKIKGEYKAPAWGNQIRSYVLHPYQLVKDLRTSVETGDAQGVLDGNLDRFIDAEIKL